MSVAVNSYLPVEVAKVNHTNSGLPEGVLLQKSRGTTNDFDLATDIIDGVLLSEIATTEVATMRQHLMHDIDFSGYTRPGENSAVAKKLNGTVAYGLALTAQGSAVAVGTSLEVASGYLRPQASGKKVAIALDVIPAGATTTGRVLVCPVAV
jgi:hypothetical protein